MNLTALNNNIFSTGISCDKIWVIAHPLRAAKVCEILSQLKCGIRRDCKISMLVTLWRKVGPMLKSHWSSQGSTQKYKHELVDTTV